MKHANQGQSGPLNGSGYRIGVVQARFNEHITDALAQRCVHELLLCSVRKEHITHIAVPGALEIPVTLKAMAEQGLFDALVAIGCIIRGETYHFELVANESAAGLSQLALMHGLPIINAVLTVENEPQAMARLDKGQDAARAAIEMIQTLRSLKNSSLVT
jgi:6,7-dimethyl-8-ribityllumazine synthase